jgi:hypothetical protein
MSYTSIAANAVDEAFVARVVAATTQEAWNNPSVADTVFAANVQAAAANATVMAWPVATATDVAAAYESALAAGNPAPGGDPAVITDGMILANVQAKWPDDD